MWYDGSVQKWARLVRGDKGLENDIIHHLSVPRLLPQYRQGVVDPVQQQPGLFDTQHPPQTEQLISLLERRGIVEDHSIVNEKARQAEQALRRNMYHNTQMMLKHYRDIVWALRACSA